MFNYKRMRLVFFGLIAVLLSGCVTHYSYDNISYASPKEALDAHSVALEKIVSDLKPINSNPNGNAVIVTPSKTTCEALGVTRKGAPSQDLINYIGSSLEMDFAFFSKFLVKSNLFNSVNPVIDEFPLQYVNKVKNDYSATIYLDMKSQEQIGWFVIIPPDNVPKQINFDKMAEKGAPKIQSWLNDIKSKLDGGESK